jgi:hypothetical protein
MQERLLPSIELIESPGSCLVVIIVNYMEPVIFGRLGLSRVVTVSGVADIITLSNIHILFA